MKNNSLNVIAKRILNSKKVAIFAHIAPDYDALGSALALKCGLEKIGIEAMYFAPEKLGFHESLIFGDENIAYELNHIDANRYDLFVSVDSPSVKRLGKYSDIFVNHRDRIVIDHHKNIDLRGNLNYICPNKSSCCEIIFSLLKTLGVKIEGKIASYLYTGLSGDTNSFKNTSTSAESFECAKELSKCGADLVDINQKIYKNTNDIEINLKKYLLNHYKIVGDCAYILVSNKVLKRLKGNKIYCEGFSTFLVNILGINYAYSVVEIENKTFSISLRSKDGYEVRSTAESLGGGGHLVASGAKITAKSVKQANAIVFNKLKEFAYKK